MIDRFTLYIINPYNEMEILIPHHRKKMDFESSSASYDIQMRGQCVGDLLLMLIAISIPLFVAFS